MFFNSADPIRMTVLSVGCLPSLPTVEVEFLQCCKEGSFLRLAREDE